MSIRRGESQAEKRTSGLSGSSGAKETSQGSVFSDVAGEELEGPALSNTVEARLVECLREDMGQSEWPLWERGG